MPHGRKDRVLSSDTLDTALEWQDLEINVGDGRSFSMSCSGKLNNLCDEWLCGVQCGRCSWQYNVGEENNSF